MNVSPQSENLGNTVHVRGACAPRGVKLKPKHDAHRNSDDSDDSDDFMALMNESKKKEADPRAFQGAAGLPGGLQSEDQGGFQLPAASDPPRTDFFDRPQEGLYERSPPPQQASFGGAPTSSFRSLEEEKQHYIYKVQRLHNRFPGRKVGMETPLDELKYEYERLVRQAEMTSSIKFQRRALMATVSGIEYLNKSFNPLGLHLDGWSETVMDSIEDFNQSFEQIHEKYQGTAEVTPEWNILITLLGSGFMFHLSNSLFKSVLPNVNDVAKNNPDLMNQIASAMGSAMNNQNAPRPPPSGGATNSQMGAALAMQAMQNKLRPSAPSIEELTESAVESDFPPGFEQATALRKPLPPMARPVPQQRIEEVDEYSGGSDVSSELSMSDAGDVRHVEPQQARKRAAPAGRGRAAAKKSKNSVDINL
uniref:Uncharacterized protein n=1 Tax=viral metagenome TaxID=1070528 RepID=A0A6C0IZN6_9ZZZZ